MTIDEKKKNLFSYKMVELKIIDILFFLVFSIIILLGYYFKIRINLFLFLGFTFFIYWFVTIVRCSKIETVEYGKKKTKLLKNKKVVAEILPEKDVKPLLKVSSIMFWDRFILIFILMFFWFAGYAIFADIDTKEFLKSADVTMGTVTDVSRNISRSYDYDDGESEIEYKVHFSYEVEYYVKQNKYTHHISSIRRYSDRDDAYEAKAKYKYGEKVEIYYQVNKPEKSRHDVWIRTGKFVYICLAVTYGYLLFAFLIMFIRFRRECKKLEAY